MAAAHLRLGRRLGLFELFSGFSTFSFVVNLFDFVNELLPIIVLAGENMSAENIMARGSACCQETRPFAQACTYLVVDVGQAVPLVESSDLMGRRIVPCRNSMGVPPCDLPCRNHGRQGMWSGPR